MMSMREASRLSVMEQIDKKVLSIDQASRELDLSSRQIKRIRKRYKLEGKQGVISKRRGVPNIRRIDAETRKKVAKLLGDPMCKGWGPTFAQEKLSELHGITVSVETLRKWMIEEGLWKNKVKKQMRIHQRRKRRSHFGELIQGDGSHHAWFESRAEKCALLVFVDDATSKITAAKFFPTETTEGYLEILKEHLERYGRPEGYYVDKHSIFRVSREEALKGDYETHFGKVLRSLKIKLICAHSPQAKGRVERANGTLQDRLIKEMRLKQISSIEEGNFFLEKFLTEYNRKFGKEPLAEEDRHLPLKETDNLERIFARKAKRKLSKNLSFQYNGILYQIQTKEPNRIQKTHVEVIERPQKPIIVEIGGKIYEYKQWEDVAYKQAPVIDAKELEASWKSIGQSKINRRHPWR